MKNFFVSDLIGSLINHKTVLTASHCIKESFEHIYQGVFYTLKIQTNKYYPTWQSMFTVYTGSNDKRTMQFGTDGTGIYVKEVIKVSPSAESKVLCNN